jgi:hypothetical protein|tara:strand:+ start:152 stop:1120 length:969 start_codon:yes stop_codon:yes gene_type:complete
VKITLERLREIITEEVIKEELAPEIAAPAIAAMLQGTDSVATSDIFGAVFDQMYGEGALEGEAERMANPEEEPEESSPTEYQPGGGEGDRPVMGFKENMNEIIQQELALVLVEELEALLNEGIFKDPGKHVKADPDSPLDQQRRAILDKNWKAKAWAAGAKERGKEIKRKEKHKVDTELENKLHSYIAMLKDFTDKAITYKSSYGPEDNKNIMDDIVNLLYGKLPYRYAADISSIDRKLIRDLGAAIEVLAKPYKVANSRLATRDYEAHQNRPPGSSGRSDYQERLAQDAAEAWLAKWEYQNAQREIRQENIENIDIEIIDD